MSKVEIQDWMFPRRQDSAGTFDFGPDPIHAVDIRRGSPTFSQWFGIELSDANKRMLWVPPGFAHGFCAMEDGSDLVYKCTTLYDPTSDRAILWNDPEIGIEWPIEEPVLSGKDAKAPRLAEAIALPVYS